MPTRDLLRRTAAATLDELLAGATDREAMKTVDSKSSATFERVRIAGSSYVVKHFSGDDWVTDASDDTEGRAVCLWEDGLYAAVADIVDSTVVAAARTGVPGSPYPAALLMRDATADLIPVDAPVDADTHAAILDAMARMHARFWADPPATTYLPFGRGYSMLSPAQARTERHRRDRSDVLRMVEPGWEQVGAQAPDLAHAVAPLLDDPAPLVDALARTPVTFLQGDWKMGNLGRRGDGTVVLLDWDRPSAGPATADLAWYVAVNCDRLPEDKDATLDRYRRALQVHGVGTDGWWDEQLTAALLGAFLQLGWSKAGQPDELAWWEERVTATARALCGRS